MSNRGRTSTADDEVDQLLRAAQDDVLLKLNVNSHIAHASVSSSIDPDLDRRFQALKKPQNPTKHGDDSRKPVPPKTESDADAEEDDDLFARFAALKNSLPSHNKNGNQRQSSDLLVMDEVKQEDNQDEVEKLVQWAIDAARLDPSPPSDDDADADDDNDDDDTDSDSDDDDKKGRRKKVTKK